MDHIDDPDREGHNRFVAGDDACREASERFLSRNPQWRRRGKIDANGNITWFVTFPTYEPEPGIVWHSSGIYRAD